MINPDEVVALLQGQHPQYQWAWRSGEMGEVNPSPTVEFYIGAQPARPGDYFILTRHLLDTEWLNEFSRYVELRGQFW